MVPRRGLRRPCLSTRRRATTTGRAPDAEGVAMLLRAQPAPDRRHLRHLLLGRRLPQTRSPRSAAAGCDPSRGPGRCVCILPVQSATALPRGVPTLAKWSRTLLVLPKFREKKWCYFDLLQQAWNDKEVMSYVKWIKNTYYTDAQKPVGGKASDLAAFLLATAFPIESRYQEICNSERIFVD